MALTVRDLTKLQCFNHMRLIAGEGGLDNNVKGMGILDYELMPEYIDDFLKTFTPGDFVLCSFLYQYCCNKPEEILPMVRTLADYGAAGIGCKTILYPKLPAEVIAYAEKHNFPIFTFGKDTYYENIVYEISDAIQTDDRNLLTDENIDAMILGALSKNKVYTIAKNLRISFKRNCRAYFIAGDSETFGENVPRYCSSFYLNRNIGNKGILTPYRGGMFMILTSPKDGEKAFEIMASDILSYLNIPEPFSCCASRVHRPFESLDKCFRESYNTYLASLAQERNYESFDDIGVYEILVSDRNSAQMEEYMLRYLSPIMDKPDYMEAAFTLVKCGGDIAKAAASYGCHQNTIRYKIARMRELTGTCGESEQEFYMNLSLAVRIYRLRQVAK